MLRLPAIRVRRPVTGTRCSVTARSQQPLRRPSCVRCAVVATSVTTAPAWSARLALRQGAAVLRPSTTVCRAPKATSEVCLAPRHVMVRRLWGLSRSSLLQLTHSLCTALHCTARVVCWHRLSCRLRVPWFTTHCRRQPLHSRQVLTTSRQHVPAMQCRPLFGHARGLLVRRVRWAGVVLPG